MGLTYCKIVVIYYADGREQEEQMTRERATKAEIREREENARRRLLEQLELKLGDTVYVIVRHVSQSGMYRVLRLFIMRNNQPVEITRAAVHLGIGRWDDRHEGLGISGCGMDMGFAAVYDLSVALFCPTEYNHDAAYALNHQWM